MKYFLVLIIFTKAVFSENEISSKEVIADVESAGFMMSPMMGGCASTCMCRQRCAMVWWMPCLCAPCNGCGCCGDNGNGNGDGNGEPTTTPTTTTSTTTTPAPCDRGCCSGCSCGSPCTIWWMCPRPCPPTCCNGGCCNSAPPPPPSCCSCPKCVPWFPCQPCRCINNCCPGSDCCSGSGCDKEEEKPTRKLPPMAEDKKDKIDEKKGDDRNKVDNKLDNKWDIKDQIDNIWNNKDQIDNIWNNKDQMDNKWETNWEDKWDVNFDDRFDDRWDDRLDTRIRDRWDDMPIRIDDILDRDRLRDRREPIRPPPLRDIRLDDWEIRDILERRDRRDSRDDLIRNPRI